MINMGFIHPRWCRPDFFHQPPRLLGFPSPTNVPGRFEASHGTAEGPIGPIGAPGTVGIRWTLGLYILYRCI